MASKQKRGRAAYASVALLCAVVSFMTACRNRHSKPTTESTIDVAHAMTMCYGNYDAEAQHSFMTTAQPSPDSRFPTNTRMVVRPIFNNLTRQAGPPRFTLVTAAVPENEPFDCHACSPLIGVAVFARSDSKWATEASNQQVTNAGGWGKPPSDIQTVQIGPNRSAVEIRDVGMGQGQNTVVLSLLIPWNGTVNLGLERILADDDAGACDVQGGLPCYSNHRTLTFLSGDNTAYYELELNLTGTDLSDNPPFHLLRVSGLERLGIKNGRYTQLFRQGNLTNLDKLVAEREGLK